MRDLLSVTDCYPCGSKMEGGSWSASGLNCKNGMEQDNEVKGDGNSYVFEARIYDSRLGRFFSTDLRQGEFVWQSPYCAMDNKPIIDNDPMGNGVGVKSNQKILK